MALFWYWSSSVFVCFHSRIWSSLSPLNHFQLRSLPSLLLSYGNTTFGALPVSPMAQAGGGSAQEFVLGQIVVWIWLGISQTGWGTICPLPGWFYSQEGEIPAASWAVWLSLLWAPAEETAGKGEPSPSSPTKLHLHPHFFSQMKEGLSLCGVDVKKIAFVEQLDQRHILLSQKKKVHLIQ